MGARLVVDHVLPVAKGGTNIDENLVCSCDVCNSGKNDSLLTRVRLAEKGVSNERIIEAWEEVMVSGDIKGVAQRVGLKRDSLARRMALLGLTGHQNRDRELKLKAALERLGPLRNESGIITDLALGEVAEISGMSRSMLWTNRAKLGVASNKKGPGQSQIEKKVREEVVGIILKHPSLSNRKLATVAGVSHSTVSAIRKKNFVKPPNKNPWEARLRRLTASVTMNA